MTLSEELKQSNAEVSSQLSQLSQCRAMILVLYSFGMIMTKQGRLTPMMLFLRLTLEKASQNMRQWLCS